MTISNNGIVHIKRYLAGFTPSIARSMAFGIGSGAESAGSTKLQFEVARSAITLTTYDFTSDRLIFKAPMPNDLEAKVNEIAIYSTETNANAGGYGSQMLADFESTTENWSDIATSTASAWASGTQRLGSEALRQAPAAGSTRTDSLSDIVIDLAGYSGADRFVIAFNAGNGNASQVRVRMMTDASNYYDYALGAQTSGYKIIEIPKASFTATGAPSWANINRIDLMTTATGGAAQIDFDGLRIDDADTINQEYVMVARELLTSAYTKTAGRNNEVEFSLAVDL